jgi:hypothetical protein
MRSAECGVRNAECGMRSAEWGVDGEDLVDGETTAPSSRVPPGGVEPPHSGGEAGLLSGRRTAGRLETAATSDFGGPAVAVLAFDEGGGGVVAFGFHVGAVPVEGVAFADALGDAAEEDDLVEVGGDFEV